MPTPPIPYFQTSRYRVATMVELAKPQLNEKVADLGSGDGRITIAFAESYNCHARGRGGGHQEPACLTRVNPEDTNNTTFKTTPPVQVYGYEIDPQLRQLSQENIQKAGLTNAHILNLDFWQEDLSRYDIIACYPMPTVMNRLEHKLREELKPGARIVLNYFPFNHWKEKNQKDNIYLYIK